MFIVKSANEAEVCTIWYMVMFENKEVTFILWQTYEEGSRIFNKTSVQMVHTRRPKTMKWHGPWKSTNSYKMIQLI